MSFFFPLSKIFEFVPNFNLRTNSTTTVRPQMADDDLKGRIAQLEKERRQRDFQVRILWSLHRLFMHRWGLSGGFSQARILLLLHLLQHTGERVKMNTRVSLHINTHTHTHTHTHTQTHTHAHTCIIGRECISSGR